eukprot:595075_1
MSSIALSFFSVAARFTSDDRIFFVKEAEKLGLRFQRRFPKKDKPQDSKAPKIHDDTGSPMHMEEDEEILNETGTDVYSRETTKGETSPALDAKQPSLSSKQVDDVEYTNPSIQINQSEPTFIKFRYIHDMDAMDAPSTECRVQTAKIYPNSNENSIGTPESCNTPHEARNIVLKAWNL